MMEHGTLEERAVVVQTLEPQLVALSFDMYGCRVVQKVNFPFFFPHIAVSKEGIDRWLTT